ncbi:MAG: glutaredoxin domain-containing protein [Chloroflexota bacterium]|nr:glutaredoxin domain-containing protein [Chloroflexota bacterium]
MADKQVKVYSTDTCPWCTKVKGFLKDNSIEFQEFNVGTDKAARDEMVEKSGQMGVPVTDIDGTIIVGFQEDVLKDKLGLA